jgi:hypothetical protein
LGPIQIRSDPSQTKFKRKKEALRVDLRKNLFSGPFILRAIYYGEK